MSAKRVLSLLLTLSMLCVVSSSCKTGGTAKSSSKESQNTTVTAILDSSAVLSNFDTPQEALDTFENNLATGQIKDTPDQEADKANLLLLKKYTETNHIDLVSVDWGWGDTLTQKLTSAFLAKEGPDVIIGETQMPGFAQQGYLAPFPDELASYVRKNISAAAWKPMEYNGKIYGVALEPSIAILMWNKKILKESGLNPDKAPTTWDELLNNIKTVYSKGTYSGGGFYSGPSNGGYLRFGAFLKGAGGGFTDASGNPDINNSKNVSAFDFIRQMYKYNSQGILTASDETTFLGAFDKGQIAYKVDGLWAIAQEKEQGLDCGYSQIPVGPDGKSETIVIGAGFQGVPAYSKNKDAAFKLIEQMISSDFQQNIAKGGLRIPVLKSINSSDSYKKQQPALAQFVSGLDGNVTGLPTFSGDAAKAWSSIGNAMTQAMTTSEPIQSILDDAQKQLKAAVASK